MAGEVLHDPPHPGPGGGLPGQEGVERAAAVRLAGSGQQGPAFHRFINRSIPSWCSHFYLVIVE